MSVPLTLTDEEIDEEARGTRGADSYLYRRDLAPGTGNIRTLDDDSIIFTYVCPCGCGAVTFVEIATNPVGHVWKWNGNKEKPTLSPSLQQHSACRWHGFVRRGQFEKA